MRACENCARAVACDARTRVFCIPPHDTCALIVTLPRARACACGALVCGECSGTLIDACTTCVRARCERCFVGERMNARESVHQAFERIVREGTEPQGAELQCALCRAGSAVVEREARLLARTFAARHV